MKKRLKDIRVVFIDIDNTLLDFHKSAEDAMQKAFNKHGIEFKNGYSEVFHRVNDGLWLEIEKGSLTRDELWQIRFNRVLSALGLNGDGPSIERDFRKELFDSAFPIDGAIELLKYLSQRYKVFAATNAIYNQQVNRLKKVGMFDYFSGLFVSEKIGYQKPTKEFFDCCFSNIDKVLPEQTVMIGDSISADIEGGLNYGMTTVWFNPNQKPIGKVKPHFVIRSLLEIKSIL